MAARSVRWGDWTSPEIVDEATTFAEEGYVNISIDYRLEQPGCRDTFSNCIPAIQEATVDAQSAVRFLRDNAPAVRRRPDPHRHRWILVGAGSPRSRLRLVG